jgi:nitroreductase
VEHRRVVAARRMVRHYTGEPVGPAALDRIAAAAVGGPTAGNSGGVSVVVVTDAATRGRIARLAGEPGHTARGFDPWLSSAPAHLVLVVEPDRYRARYDEPDKDPAALAIPWWWVDGGAAMVLAALAAVDEGLAAGFLGGHRLGGVGDLLGVPPGAEVLGLLTVGHPAPDRRSSSLDRPTPARRVHRESWEHGPPANGRLRSG